MAETVGIELQERVYDVELHRRTTLPPDAPRLVVVSYQPNEQARSLLRACLDAFEKLTPEPHEMWVVDNNSPAEALDWLRARPRVNLALSRTEPAPPGKRGLWTRLFGGIQQRRWGSYANAVGLELAARLVDPATERLMTLHMDTAPARVGWLSYLTAKVSGDVAAAGVRMDTGRSPDGVLHVLGCLADQRVVRALGLTYWPDLPARDVGDTITYGLRFAGKRVHACRNTHTDPSLAERLPAPFRDLPVDRALDDDGNVIFLHLGRGIVKSAGGAARGISPDEWVRFVDSL